VGNLGVDWRIILKFLLKKYDVRLYPVKLVEISFFCCQSSAGVITFYIKVGHPCACITSVVKHKIKTTLGRRRFRHRCESLL
jgi:hypothetical protein